MNKRTETMLYREAMFFIIDDALRKGNITFLEFDENTYDKESDMVHFQLDGYKCRLIGVGEPNMTDGTLTMQIAYTDVNKITKVDSFVFNISMFRCKTLERIAYEAYDWTKDANDDCWEEYLTNKVAAVFDSYNYLA